MKERSSRALAICFVLMPILLYYDFPFTSINMGTTICFVVFLALLTMVLSRGTLISVIKGNIYFALFSIYLMASLVFRSLLFDEVEFVNVLFVIANVLSTFIIFGGNNFVNKKWFIKFYKCVAFFAIAFYLLQLFFGLIFGVIIPGRIPLLSLTESFKGIKTDIFVVPKTQALNYCYSIFSEQSHFAVFLLPLFSLFLVEKRSKRIVDYIKILFVMGIIILTNSANGMIGLIILLLAFFIVKYSGQKRIRFINLFTTLLTFSILLFGLYLVLNRISYFNEMFVRLFSDFGNKSSKAGYRIYRGFYLVGTMDFRQLLLGLGYLQIHNYVLIEGITTPYDLVSSGPGLEYTNFVCQIILYFGVVGLILFLLSIIKFIKRIDRVSVPFLVCLVALWFSSSMFFEQTFLFFIVFAICLGNSKTVVNNKTSDSKNRICFCNTSLTQTVNS